ncbi:hypothetical protein ACUW9N_002187 [Staphylococcus auricularis]|uniref:Transcriptional regulator n=1 Tax=Staphylococcus auricularis TaxID=29379 RepID=A0AAW7MA76_9STAP|nr:hypothetical protein [Staphylococcus auricularis]MCG7342364.1 hypothetical protein [Staphylococcus auricularis]MDC6328239.1 hypothetical protein [Staphylococcus auricularis]MDN4532170.1 hypothetical protein [Staphylococcus auricularis]
MIQRTIKLFTMLAVYELGKQTMDFKNKFTHYFHSKHLSVNEFDIFDQIHLNDEVNRK